MCLYGCGGHHVLVSLGGGDGAIGEEHAPEGMADSAIQPAGEDAPRKIDGGIETSAVLDSGMESLVDVLPENTDTGSGAADGMDVAVVTLGLDTNATIDAGPLPNDGSDGRTIDGGGNPLAGLRIAFVGTENPTSELSLTTWLTQTTGVVPARILTSSVTLTADLLANYDVLILERLVRSYSQIEASVFTAWVTGGGAVLSIGGFFSSGSDSSNTNSLLSGIGIAYGSYVLGSAGGPFYITELASHPIMAGITSLPFWGGFTVQPTAIADGLGTNTTLATSASQPIGVVQARGQGRVLVWGDEWVENDAVSATANVRGFWLQALTWLARR